MFLILVMAAVLLWQAFDVRAASKLPSGRDVYKQECARCHGKSGEGVKGKYDEALRGDRTLEKLTRYIERAMPDDNPGKCTGDNAAAVAKYIYDSFYSRESQAKLHPARIELARLTNRQYRTAVADLVKQFTGADGKTVSEKGLKASYYDSHNFDGNKKDLDRTDRQVDFDFADKSPAGTNHSEFAVQWRGSLLADETGDYEFILKTPNGARLYINDDEEPLIDAWVASGKASEYRATVKLLGGRAYPLRLKYFKFKQNTAAVSLSWKPPRGTMEIIPARNLSPASATPTLVITTPFPPDDSSVGYERGVSVSKAWDEATTQAAIEVANYVAREIDSLAHTKADSSNRVEAIQKFCTEFVGAAFRRPLSDEEKQVFVANQFKKKGKTEEAVKRVVLLALKSPEFLYLGLKGGPPDGYERAARLSFGLWDSVPDATLRRAVEQGKLQSEEQVRRQAERMLTDARTRAKMQGFFQHWLQMDRVEPLSKDGKLYPGFTPEIIADLRTSLNLFLEEAVWEGAGDYRTLLLADYLYVNNPLAEFYGVTTNASGDYVKVQFAPGERCGVLTHPYLLSAFSYPRQTSPIHRGVFLTRNIVGRSLRPPPMAQTFKDADFAPNLTMREKVAQLTKPQSCQTCHSVINPLGFSLESFDAVGRYRTQENDHPINAVSEYVTEEGEKVRLAGARDIAEFALSNQQAQTIFVEQLFHHVVKQPARAYGADTLERLRKAFVASGFNVRKLLVEIAVVSAMQGSEGVEVKKTAEAKRK